MVETVRNVVGDPDAGEGGRIYILEPFLMRYQPIMRINSIVRIVYSVNAVSRYSVLIIRIKDQVNIPLKKAALSHLTLQVRAHLTYS